MHLNKLLTFSSILILLFSSCEKEETNPEIINSLFFGEGVYDFSESPYSNYFEFGSGNLERAFSEDFGSMGYDWFVGESSGEYKVNKSDGFYYMRNYEESTARKYAVLSQIDTTRDFQIECRMAMIVAEQGDGGAGIVLGNGSEFLGLVYNVEHYSAVLENNNGETNGLFGYNKNNELGAVYGFQKLMIRKVDNTYYFFINEEYIGFKLRYESLGSEVGFFVGSGIKMKVDYMYIDYINL